MPPYLRALIFFLILSSQVTFFLFALFSLFRGNSSLFVIYKTPKGTGSLVGSTNLINPLQFTNKTNPSKTNTLRCNLLEERNVSVSEHLSLCVRVSVSVCASVSVCLCLFLCLSVCMPVSAFIFLLGSESPEKESSIFLIRKLKTSCHSSESQVEEVC